MTQMHFNNQLLFHGTLGEHADSLLTLEDANLYQLNDINKFTLLHHAAAYGNKDSTQHLINLGVDVDAQNSDEETPLMLAVKGNHREVVNMLLKANADIFIRNKGGECVLGKAYRMPKIKMSIKTALLKRVTFESLSKNQFVEDTAFHDDCPLHYFIAMKNTEIIRVLLEKNSPVDAKDCNTQRTALHQAVRHLDLEIVQLLLKFSADVNARDYEGKRPLAMIENYNHEKALLIVKVLIKAGATFIDHDPTEMLMWSILSNGNRQLIRAVLQCNINWHVKNKYGRTCLGYLFDNQNSDVYEELRNFKIGLSLFSEDKIALLFSAVAKGNASSVKFLLETGVDVNVKDCHGRSPLCMAVDSLLSICSMASNNKERLNIIKMLFKYGADPQILTKENYSHISAFSEPVTHLVVDLMKPVFSMLALYEVSGRMANQFMQSEIEKRPQYKAIFDLNKQQLAEMKQIKIDESVTLFDFLIAKQVSLFAENEQLFSNLIRVMKNISLDSCYYQILQENLVKLTRLLIINEVFIKFHNVSVLNIVEKIVDYL